MAISLFYAMLGVFYMTYITKHEVAALVACETVSSSPATIPLTCSNNQMIHVISKIYGDKGRGQTCLDTMDSCTKTFTNDGDGLIVICNGKQTCHEVSMTVPPDCDPTNLTFEIEYECIDDSIDICTPVNKSMDGIVYIHSPGFPDSVGVNDSCHCNITGSLMRIMVFEHRSRQGVATLSIDNTKTWSSFLSHYNRVIASRAESVILNYDNYNMSDVNVWISIAGSMSVTCWRGNTGALITEPTSTSSSRYPTSSMQQTTDSESAKSEVGGVSSALSTDPHTSSADHTSTSSASSTESRVSSSPATDAQTSSADHHTMRTPPVSSTEKVGRDASNSDSNTVPLVAAICGVIIIILLIIISLLVYFKVIKPKRNEPSNKENINITEIPNNGYAPYEDVSDSTGRQGSRDTSNTYSDLSRYENTDGFHEYGKIHTYSNTE